MKKKINVLFIGSFKSKAKDGSVGGQMFACQTILESELNDFINWHLIDSTADSNITGTIAKRMYKAFKRIFLFIRILIARKIEVILIFTADGLSFWEKGFMALIGKFFRKRIILAPRSGIIINNIEARGLLSKFIPFVILKCDYIICQSYKWQVFFKNITKENNTDKYIVINNWIDTKKYINLSTLHGNINNVPIRILFLSWVDKNKGIFELLEAAKKLKEDEINFKIFIAGQGMAYEKVKYFIEQNELCERVELCGWVLGKKKLELLKNSDIYVLPSYYEGYPNSLLEAMAVGKACIATNVGSIPDIIENNKNGILIERKDCIELYKNLKEVILNKNLRIALGKNAQEFIIKNNSIEKGVNSYKKIFKACVE